MAQMIKITPEFAAANHNQTVEDGLNVFGCNQTIGGDYFCDPNSLITHPELFEGMTIEYIEVGYDDIDNAIEL